METLQEKQARLFATLIDMNSVLVAFSGGVDSSLLLYLAHQALKDRCVAITAYSHSLPQRELKQAQSFCEAYGIKHLVFENNEFSIEGFSANPPERCYLCKKALFNKIREIAAAQGLAFIIEGSNLDDENDYRPGKKALEELGIRSPLRDAGFTKADIRSLSLSLGLPTADKQSFACLSTRFLTGEEITLEGLARVDKAEQYLLDRGFKQVRVRSHLDLARIETDKEGMATFADPELCSQVHAAFIGFGFRFVSLDLAGYRAGSMNAL